MLTSATRLRLQAIIERIGNDQTVSLGERIYLQKFADRDQSVASWLRRARRRQLVGDPQAGLDRLLADVDLGEVEPGNPSRDDPGDIGEWFSGARGWLRRS
jgi:hypothetical protein